ncbi:hypothetical protein [Streptomyces sp. NPDC048411]|uniref:hypothetical protein n=1 Tax=Streptomyces sp. NPDC048411 TaxID=3157206 RepID=UPI003451CA1D
MDHGVQVCVHLDVEARRGEPVLVPDLLDSSMNVLHLYRTGLALVPAAGRAVVRRARRVKPATAR